MTPRKLLVMIFYSILTFFIPHLTKNFIDEQIGQQIGFVISGILYTYYGKKFIRGGSY